MTTLNQFAIAKYILCIFPQNDTLYLFVCVCVASLVAQRVKNLPVMQENQV